jgi:hypothetical protein
MKNQKSKVLLDYPYKDSDIVELKYIYISNSGWKKPIEVLNVRFSLDGR